MRKTTLTDNLVPDSATLANILVLARAVIKAVDDRWSLISSLGIDPEFAMPASNWGPDSRNDYQDAYKLLATLEWDQIKYLRFRSRMFTGYSLMHLSAIPPKTKITDPVPEDFDAKMRDEPETTVDGDFTIGRWLELARGMPKRFIYRPKPMLGEVGWWMMDDVLVNSDIVAYQERLSLMYQARIFDRIPARPRILEIGGGYGALAYALIDALPGCEYWIVDLPESLLFSCLYLGLTRGRNDLLWFLPNYYAEKLYGHYDLVINTLSLTEMSSYQANVYGRIVSELIGTKGIFFEQNHAGTGKDAFGKHFSNRARIEPDFPVRQGVPEIWWNGIHI